MRQLPDGSERMVSQNLRIIDRIRNACGLGHQADYSVRVLPSIQPVMVVPNDVVVPLQYEGTTPATAGAGVGFRSEIGVSIATGFFPPGGLLEFYITVLTVAGLGYELLMPTAIAGATNLAVQYNDVRLGICGLFSVNVKNTAAATAISRQWGGLFIPGGGPLRLGPFWITDIAGFRTLMIRASADNQAVSAIIDWKILSKAV